MDKEDNILNKEINLHVNDIKRIQGSISKLANKKGEINDELRRNKDRARKTMKTLENSKKIENTGSPEKGMRGTAMMTHTGGGSSMNNEESPIDLLLFSNNMKRAGAMGSLMASSLANTVTSGSDTARSEEHTSELQSPDHLVCRLLLEKKKKYYIKMLENIVVILT